MSIRDFQIVSKLGQGSYSTVFKALRTSDNKHYAVKRVPLKSLSTSEKLNALNEVRILASIQNQFVVSYKQAFVQEKEQTLYIVMEFAEAGDLKNRIKANQRNNSFFQEKSVWKFIMQACLALKQLHNKKIVHCDLKSANVFLTQDGKFKLGDMNVSKVAKNGLIYTQTGTPYYASPEVWREEPFDSKSDVWSLGIIIYEMAANSLPFLGNSVEQLFQNIQKGEFKSIPSHYSLPLNQLIQSCLNKDPFKRPSPNCILTNPGYKTYFDQLELKTPSQNSTLLDTIRINDPITLNQKLPKPKYEEQQKPKRKPSQLTTQNSERWLKKDRSEQRINKLKLYRNSPVNSGRYSPLPNKENKYKEQSKRQIQTPYHIQYVQKKKFNYSPDFQMRGAAVYSSYRNQLPSPLRFEEPQQYSRNYRRSSSRTPSRREPMQRVPSALKNLSFYRKQY